jgi:thioredoxin 1
MKLLFLLKNFIFVFFFIRWCGPCVRISPKLEEWSSGDFKDSVVFLKIDVDEVEEATKVYKIEAMPTFVFFKDGEEIHRLVGANVEQLKADLVSKSQ